MWCFAQESHGHLPCHRDGRRREPCSSSRRRHPTSRKSRWPTSFSEATCTSLEDGRSAAVINDMRGLAALEAGCSDLHKRSAQALKRKPQTAGHSLVWRCRSCFGVQGPAVASLSTILADKSWQGPSWTRVQRHAVLAATLQAMLRSRGCMKTTGEQPKDPSLLRGYWASMWYHGCCLQCSEHPGRLLFCSVICTQSDGSEGLVFGGRS